MARGSEQMQRTAIKPKPKKASREYEAAKDVLMNRSGGRCEYVGEDGVRCTAAFTDRHHIKRRSQGGTDDPANLWAFCNPCHIYEVHGDPERSGRLGYLTPPKTGDL